MSGTTASRGLPFTVKLITLAIALATAGVVYLVLSAAGYWFMTSHENAIAETILTDHQGAIASIYLRILVGYLATAVVCALALHPFVRGWKVVPAKTSPVSTRARRIP